MKLQTSRSVQYGAVPVTDADRNHKRSYTFLLLCGVTSIVCMAAIVALVVVVGFNGQGSRNPTSAAGRSFSVLPPCDEKNYKRMNGKADEKCWLCANPDPTIFPHNYPCKGGVYYDEQKTCECITCKVNNCCPPGDHLNPCPVGSFQPMLGQTTCLIIKVSTYTHPMINPPEKNKGKFWLSGTSGAGTPSAKFPFTSKLSCPKSLSPNVGAVLSGFVLDKTKPMSIAISAELTDFGTAQGQAIASRQEASTVYQFAYSRVRTCIPKNSILTMGSVSVKNILAGSEKHTVLTTKLSCGDASPKVFVALNKLSALDGNALSVSVSGQAISNEDQCKGDVRAKVRFSSSKGVTSAGALVVAYCQADDTLFGEQLLQSGTVDGGDFPGAYKQVEGSNTHYQTKDVTFANEMDCANPSVALGLLEVDLEDRMAVNLELLETTSTGFRMQFYAMGVAKLKKVRAAYLAACPTDAEKVQQQVDTTCSQSGN